MIRVPRPPIIPSFKPQNPTIECHDGFTISVQASSLTYATPREDNPSTPYTHVECGFPSRPPMTEALREYAENMYVGDTVEHDIDYCETVYPYTPVEVVQAELDCHGGIKKGKMP